MGIRVDRSEVGNDRFKTQLQQPADTRTVAANVKAWMASLGRKPEAGAISIDDSSRCKTAVLWNFRSTSQEGILAEFLSHHEHLPPFAFLRINDGLSDNLSKLECSGSCRHIIERISDR